MMAPLFDGFGSSRITQAEVLLQALNMQTSR